MANIGSLFMTKTSKSGKVSLASSSIVNLVGLRLLTRWRNCCILLVHVANPWKCRRIWAIWRVCVSSAVSSECSIIILLTTGDMFPIAVPVFWTSVKQLWGGLVSLWLYKTTSYGIEKDVFTLHIPSWAPHTYDFVVLTSLTHPRKIILFVLQIGK
jgi:hypothetical protein